MVGTEQELGSLHGELVATVPKYQAVGIGSPGWGTGCHVLGTGIPCTVSQVSLTGSLAVFQWALSTGTGYPRLGTSAPRCI